MENVAKKKRNKILYYVLGYSIVIVFGIFMTIWSEKSEVIEKVEYPLIENINKELCGRVISYRTSWVFSGSRRVNLSTGDKFAVSGTYPYTKDLYEYIKSGDSICKPVNCDTVYVYRHNKMEYFILPHTKN